MKVLKVVAEGITTSFRYPHFMQQVHPTFPMPPPATIYGHIASALGEWFDPEGVHFAYHFTYEGQTNDKEHIILLAPAVGYLPDTKFPKVIEGNVNPFERELLFKPRLTLYLDQPQWRDAFRSPHYAVSLGRSQDLFSYTSVEVLELQRAERAYFEHTLLPYDMTLQIQRGVAMLMPRQLDYGHNRRPTFDRYLVLQQRVFLPPDEGPRFVEGPSHYWVDPTSPEHEDAHLGLVFLSFTGDSIAARQPA